MFTPFGLLDTVEYDTGLYCEALSDDQELIRAASFLGGNDGGPAIL